MWQLCSVNWFLTGRVWYMLDILLNLTMNATLNDGWGAFTCSTYGLVNALWKGTISENTPARTISRLKNALEQLRATQGFQLRQFTGIGLCALPQFSLFLWTLKQTRSSWFNCALRDDEAVCWVSIGYCEALAVGNWWYLVSRGHLCLYILHKVEIWKGVTHAWQTDWLTTLKDRATQLLIKFKTGALVTQFDMGTMWNRRDIM